MKKLLMLMIMVLTCLFAFTANAENQPARQEGMDWEISMMPHVGPSLSKITWEFMLMIWIP